MLELKDLPTLLRAGETAIACEVPLQEKENFLQFVWAQCRLPHASNCYLWNLGVRRILQLQWCESLGWTRQPVTGYEPPSRSASIEEHFSILEFLQDFPEPGIFIVENLFPWLDGDRADTRRVFLGEYFSSRILNLAASFGEKGNRHLLLLGPRVTLSPHLEAVLPQVAMPPPTLLDVSAHLESQLVRGRARDRVELSQSALQGLARAAAGLTLAQVDAGLNLIAERHGGLDENSPRWMRDYKISQFARLNIEFQEEPNVQIGGLKLIQEDFAKFARLLEPEALRHGLQIPKGVILAGPPGTGKSFCAKRCAQMMGVSLILADWGALMGATPAASEANLRRLLYLAEATAPVVLYFDDMDKGLAVAESNADGGIARRLTGKLLTWMQDRTAPVLVLASVNRLQWLPPELTRPGRFDYIYYVDLPQPGERKEVMHSHLQRFDRRFANADPFSFEQWQSIIKRTHKCSNAEVATIVAKAAMRAFCEGRPGRIEIADLLAERETVNPLALREADKIAAMRRHARQVGLPASAPDTSPFAHPVVEEIC